MLAHNDKGNIPFLPKNTLQAPSVQSPKGLEIPIFGSAISADSPSRSRAFNKKTVRVG